VSQIVYIHSPISYTLTKKIIENGIIEQKNIFVIYGRGMTVGDSVHVENDGIWDIKRTMIFLKAVMKSGFKENIDIYLPHTAFLLGKLVKAMHAFSGYYYIEEGRTSLYTLNSLTSNKMIDPLELNQELVSSGVKSYFNLPDDFASLINQEGNTMFDGGHLKYKGSFALTPNAFKNFLNVKFVELDIIKHKRKIIFKKNTLVILPSSTEIFGDSVEKSAKLTFIMRYIAEKYKIEGHNLIIKRHPQDHKEDPRVKYFVDYFNNLGVTFDSFNFESKVDPFLEPALLGFEKYLVFGNSSAEDYLKMYVKETDYAIVRMDFLTEMADSYVLQ
jgi:hypothetical protein